MITSFSQKFINYGNQVGRHFGTNKPITLINIMKAWVVLYRTYNYLNYYSISSVYLQSFLLDSETSNL